MHICFISGEFPLPGVKNGGVGTFLLTICRGLISNGHKVSVVGYTISDHHYVNFEGIDVYCLKNNKGGRFLKWFYKIKKIEATIKEIHAKNPIDYVEAADLGLAFIKKNPKIKYGIRMHGGHHFFAKYENKPINKWKAFLEKKSYANADIFFGVSKFVVSETTKYLSTKNRPVNVVYNPIDTVNFKPIPDININKYSILFAGSICEKKGVRQLVLSFPQILEAFPEATLNLYGRDWFFPDGRSYIEYLKNDIIVQFPDNVKERIIFHGAFPITELPKKIAQAHVCVFPSHMETLGLVAPESMAVQKPVVFSELGPGPEVVTPFKTGLLCNPHQPKDIADKVCWFFAHPEETIEIAKNARQFVVDNFNVSKIVQRNIEIIQQIITK